MSTLLEIEKALMAIALGSPDASMVTADLTTGQVTVVRPKAEGKEKKHPNDRVPAGTVK